MTVLALPGGRLTLDPARPLLMGIVNAGPDSFSDAVRLTTLAAQLDAARGLVADGADIVDVGGESGVTYTAVTEADEEIARVVPLVEALAAEGVVVSVDTWKAPVAAAALGAGAQIVNDVSGLRDPEVARVAGEHGAGLVVMHTRAAPKQARVPDYPAGVAADVRAFLAERCAAAIAAGVDSDGLIVDPGPDFAKTPAQTVQALHDVAGLHAETGRPVLLALSRKYFVGAVTGQPPDHRLGGTLGAVAWAGTLGVPSILRVHDVRAAADALAVGRVLSGVEDVGGFDADDETLKWLRA